MTTDVAVQHSSAVATRLGFDSSEGFSLLMRAAKGFSESELVPKLYQGSPGSCAIAIEMAARMGASPLMVMQNLDVIHGSPNWRAKFLIACFNQCGRYTSLRYELDGPKGRPTGCRAWAIEKSTNERLTGPTVTLDMAKDEGWSTKPGSKWKTIPELMLMYRAAAFMIRLYAPEISMGLLTTEEVIDMGSVEEVERPSTTTLQQIKDRARLTDDSATDEEPPAAPTYAQLMDRINEATDVDVLDIIVDDINAIELPGNQHNELIAAANERGLSIQPKAA